MKNSEFTAVAFSTALEAKALSLALKEFVQDLHPSDKQKVDTLYKKHLSNEIKSVAGHLQLDTTEPLEQALSRLQSE